MITTIKTKQPVVYDTMKQLESIIYLDVSKVTIESNGYVNMYNATSDYYVLDENGNKINIKNTEAHFTREEAKELFTALGAVGDDFDTQLFDLIPKVTLYTVGQEGYWGLTSNDWEIYIPEVVEEEIVEENPSE